MIHCAFNCVFKVSKKLFLATRLSWEQLNIKKEKRNKRGLQKVA